MSLKQIKIAAMVGSGITSGGIFYISAFAIPALLSPFSSKAKGQAVLPAKTLQTQWQHIYDTGKRFFPTLSVVTSTIYLYLSYNVPNNRTLYLFSACGTISIVPYTLVMMMRNIKKIQAEIKEPGDPEDALRLRGDIETWAQLNYGRDARRGFLDRSLGNGGELIEVFLIDSSGLVRAIALFKF